MFEKNDRVGIGDGDNFRTGTALKVASDGEVQVRWDDASPTEQPMFYPAQALQLVELDSEDESVIGSRLFSIEGGSNEL